MSENMTKLAQRIDFSRIDEDGDDEGKEKCVESVGVDGKELAPFQASLWPWDNVRNKLKSAFTEVSVLLDVLNIAKDKKYMVLDPVSQDPLEYKPLAALIAKKKALGSAASIINSGVERLRSALDPVRNRSADFQSELMAMRQTWRMTKKGDRILGDLSFRSVGSRFPHTGTFEITKNESGPSTTPPNSSTSSQRLPSSTTSPSSCALKVTVPPDLEGIAYIHVSIQKSSETLASHDFSVPLPPNAISNLEASWQQKLDNAHNVLFCKELFAQLAREAVQVQLPVPTIVMGNQITATLFPGVQLNISLCHSIPPSNKNTSKRESSSSQPQPPLSRSDHKPVLEHSLHQLLRDVHYRMLHHPMPHPITATLGISRKRYLAGPEAYDKQTLSETVHSDTNLEQIIAQAQHVILRIRTLHTIDSLAKEVKDPCIVAHWMCLNSPTKSSVKVNIVSFGYEYLCRTPLVIHIESTSLKAITREGRVFHMSYEVQELRCLLLSQVSTHQIHAVHALAKTMGWKILAFTLNCGVGPIESIGTSSSLLLASPNGARVIAVQHGPESGAHVSVSSSPEEQVFFPSTLVKDPKWQNVSGSFKEVALEKIEGRNLISKMEYLMASLTS